MRFDLRNYVVKSNICHRSICLTSEIMFSSNIQIVKPIEYFRQDIQRSHKTFRDELKYDQNVYFHWRISIFLFIKKLFFWKG